MTIFGGERGDVPLESTGGELVAQIAVEQRLHMLIDLSQFRKTQIPVFMSAFLETLYRLKAQEKYRTPVMLIIDEADAIAPQKPMKGEERMLGAADDIVRRGGQRGIGCTMISQRSAVLNKNLLTQLEILFVLRTIASQDLAAVNLWIEKHGTPEQGDVLMESLPSLPIGDAWVWSPGWPTEKGLFQRVHVSAIETFDSGATPKAGERRVEPRSVADVDLEAIRKSMADTIERAAANDPVVLKKRIGVLESALKSAPERLAPDTGQIEAAEKAGYAKGVFDGLTQAGRIAGVAVARIREHLQIVDQLVHGVAVDIQRGPSLGDTALSSDSGREDIGKAPMAVMAPKQPAIKQTTRQGQVQIPSGERAVLIAIAQFEGRIRRKALGVLTGYARSSRDAYINRLSARGFLTQNGEQLAATRDGINALGDFKPLPTGRALQEYWLANLPEGEGKILKILIDNYPKSVQRSSIDEWTPYARSSRDAYLNRLAAKLLVSSHGSGSVIASADLF